MILQTCCYPIIWPQITMRKANSLSMSCHLFTCILTVCFITLAEGTAARVEFSASFFCISTTNQQSLLTKRIVGSKNVMYTGRVVAMLNWTMDREKGVRSECTLKILNGTGTNVTSDNVLRLSVSTKCGRTPARSSLGWWWEFTLTGV